MLVYHEDLLVRFLIYLGVCAAVLAACYASEIFSAAFSLDVFTLCTMNIYLYILGHQMSRREFARNQNREQFTRG